MNITHKNINIKQHKKTADESTPAVFAL